VRKLFVAITMSALAVLVLATPALAGRTWCARDPIVRINNHDVQLWVAVPSEYVSLVSGPIDIQILTAQPVTSEVLFLDEGFNEYGETVTFGALKRGKVYSDGSFDIQLKVQVPINDRKIRDIPLQLTFTIGGEATVVSTDASTTDSGDATVMTENTVTYSGGYTFTVEMTNDNTTLTARFPAS
jgi:hypothetical protein